MKTTHCSAIVLAAGSGKRMNSATAKQYIVLEGKPIIWYSLQTVEQSEVIEDCILVASPDDISYVKEEIVEKYGFQKPLHIFYVNGKVFRINTKNFWDETIIITIWF